MKIFLNYLKDFLKEDFHKGYYLSIAILVITAITINYSIDLEDGIIDKIPSFYFRSGSFFLLYFGLYLVVLLINWFFYRENSFWKNKMFWIYLILGLVLFSFDAAFQPSRLLAGIPSELRLLTGKTLSNLISIFSLFIPFWIYYKLVDRSQPSFYGLTRKGFIARPYIQLFSIVIPLAIAGSFLPGFQQQYPMYISSNAHEYLNIPEWITIATYEIAYGWNFLTIELLFRGFLVIGMVKLLGRHAILPMAIVYASIHFGKPLGECISSIFGGYILGVIAYYSRNIWGGVVIHLGLAWLMEIVSAFHKVFS